ncbi:TPA: LiaF domain-containing protein [Streptococcus suis]
MKKSYSWQIILVILALYLILLAFFPNLSVIFDYFRLTLVISLAFLWLGTEHKNAILFFIGLAFSALYINELVPYGYHTFNIAPLFLGILVLGLAIHSINKKRSYHKMIETAASATTIISNDAEFLHLEANFTNRYEYSNSNALKAVNSKAFFGTVVIDLTEAQFEKELTYITIKQTLSTTTIRLPKSVAVTNGLKSGLGEVFLPTQGTTNNYQVYLTGTNTLSKVSIQFID